MKAGLYQPDEFKDNCGFGLIAHMQGEPSHTLLQTAIEALTCMTHRGGINADGKTGDGCGLLIQKPDQFLRAVAKAQFAVDLPKQYAVGMVFFNQDPIKDEAARNNMNREILAAGLSIGVVAPWNTGRDGDEAQFEVRPFVRSSSTHRPWASAPLLTARQW